MYTLHLRYEDRMCMALIMMKASISFFTSLFLQPWTTAVVSTCKTTLVPYSDDRNDKKCKRTPMASRVLLIVYVHYLLHKIIGFEAKISLRF